MLVSASKDSTLKVSSCFFSILSFLSFFLCITLMLGRFVDFFSLLLFCFSFVSSFFFVTDGG